MTNSPLEFLAKKYGNVVRYDSEGNIAGIFVKFPKMKSSDLVAGLPNHTHPAFIINGVEQDYILLGKYKAGRQTAEADCPLVSLPNINPANNIGADDSLSRMKLAGAGISGMTIADYGFVKLLAQKHGWVPKGNTFYGQSHKDATPWKTNVSATVGMERAFEGYVYTCIEAHTTSFENRPGNSKYWEKGKKIGGTVDDIPPVGNISYGTGPRTLNGTGPLDWRLGNDPGGICDIIGSVAEYLYGYRIVNKELQILENNDAADPTADLSASSASWKAILPNLSDDGYTLVSPGTAGTLHWNYLANTSKIILDTQYGLSYSTTGFTLFSNLEAHATRLPYVPSIVKELGLFPTDSNDDTEGRVEITFQNEEVLPKSGGSGRTESRSGLGFMICSIGRSNTSEYHGCRARALP